MPEGERSLQDFVLKRSALGQRRIPEDWNTRQCFLLVRGRQLIGLDHRALQIQVRFRIRISYNPYQRSWKSKAYFYYCICREYFLKRNIFKEATWAADPQQVSGFGSPGSKLHSAWNWWLSPGPVHSTPKAARIRHYPLPGLHVHFLCSGPCLWWLFCTVYGMHLRGVEHAEWRSRVRESQFSN